MRSRRKKHIKVDSDVVFITDLSEVRTVDDVELIGIDQSNSLSIGRYKLRDAIRKFGR